MKELSILSFCLLGVLMAYGGALFVKYLRSAECPRCRRWRTTRMIEIKMINCLESREVVTKFDTYFDFYGNDIKRSRRRVETSYMVKGDLAEIWACSHCRHEWTICVEVYLTLRCKPIVTTEPRSPLRQSSGSHVQIIKLVPARLTSSSSDLSTQVESITGGV